MSSNILDEYSNNNMGGNVATNGGQQTPKDIPYSTPVGPKSINDPKTPGIHGTNHGNCGSQGRR